MKYIPLSELTTKIGSGSTPKGGKDSYHKTGISLIRSLNVYDYIFKKNNLAYIDEKQAQKLKNVIVEENDILLNITGASVCRCTIVPKDILPARVNQHVSIIRVNPKVLIPQFALHAINSSSLKQGLFNLAMTGATREALTKNDILSYKLPVPVISNQKKIAAILSAYDDLIENNKRRIALLEKMAEEIYREWFVRFRFPGYQTAEFAKGIPKGWEQGSLGEIANMLMGQSPKSEFYNDTGNGLPFHQGVGTYGDRFPVNDTYCSVEGRVANGGDILFSVRAPVGRLNISNTKMIIGRGLAALSHKEGFNSYLFYLLRVAFSNEDIIGNGSIFNSVGKDELKGFKLLLPPNLIVQKFDQIAANIDKQIGILINVVENLTKTKQMLLPRLISGKLSVEDLDIQFPPSMQEDHAA